MPQPIVEKLILTLLVLLSIATVLLSLLTPGFALDNTLVYQGF